MSLFWAIINETRIFVVGMANKRKRVAIKVTGASNSIKVVLQTPDSKSITCRIQLSPNYVL